ARHPRDPDARQAREAREGARGDLQPLGEDLLALLLELLELGERLGLADAELDLLALDLVEREVLLLHAEEFEKSHLMPAPPRPSGLPFPWTPSGRRTSRARRRWLP